jgi:Kdo2-lipid IVA lauroyltransferase/acyltransferase
MEDAPQESEPADSPPEKGSFVDWFSDLLIRGLLAIALRLPYDRRIPFMGWLLRRVVSPIAGYRRRAMAHLAKAVPALSPRDRRRIADGVADNFGRSVAEIYSGADFVNRIAAADPLSGPGLPALMAAIAAGRPVIIAVAHFGNYDAMRSALVARGITVGAVYRPMDNPWFNAHYTKAIHAIAEPLFARNRPGIVAMLRFLKSGGVLALGVDQYYSSGAELRFFGLPALTTLSPAEFALKYDCDLIPIHAIRQPDGLTFNVRVDEPILHTNAHDMMQAVNDNLEQVVRDHMDQWFWVHRRWKPARAKRVSAAPPPP